MEGVEQNVAANERYRIEGKLGNSETGTVYAARDTQKDCQVAIKRIPDSMLNTPGNRAQVLKESAALKHPNISPILDISADAESSFAVMEFIEGENLHELVQRSVLIQRDFVTLARQLLLGLDAAHKSALLHHDLKPGNVMLNWQPDSSFVVKILNFGLARLIPPPSETKDTPISPDDSVHTAAPERLAGESIDARTDLYSAGCIFYYVLTGHFPFPGATAGEVRASHRDHAAIPLSQYRPDLQPEICNWVMQLLSRKAADRPASAKAAEALLGAIVDGPRLRTPVKGPVQMVARETPPPEPAPAKPRSKTGVLLLLLVVLLGGGIGGFAWWQSRQQETVEKTADVPVKTTPKEDPTDPLDSVAKPEVAPLLTTQIMDPSGTVDVLPAADLDGLRKLLGKHVIVQGKVIGKGSNKAGTIDYLNFTNDYRDSASLVFFHRPGDPPAAPIDLDSFIGHTIRADGVVSEHRGNLQIAIRNVSQISVVD